MLKKADALVQAGDLNAILDYGAELSEEIKAACVELEKLKKFVKDEAIKRNKAGEESPVKIAHSYGKTSITIMVKKWKQKRGRDPLELENELPEGVFDTLFNTPRYVTFKLDFEKQFKAITQEQRDKVRLYFEFSADQPRVSFPDLPAKQVVIATAATVATGDSVPTQASDDDAVEEK